MPPTHHHGDRLMNVVGSSSYSKPPLYICGIPGRMGGASTKILHLIGLLHQEFSITVVAPEIWVQKDKDVKRALGPQGISCIRIQDLPNKTDAVVLGICDRDFFSAGRALKFKQRGFRVVWSNEMMFPFKGEAEAAAAGLIDRVLFVSEFQQRAFGMIHNRTPSLITGNYIDPEDYRFRERRHPVFSIGRLSRPDPAKFPLDFPVLYEELGLQDAKFRIMAWSQELQKIYRWHRFGPQWELLNAQQESALHFLYSLDVFLYPLGHRVKESWGRSVVEAMLTGCVPVVPTGHQFHTLISHGETGFICSQFEGFRAAVLELYQNYPSRLTMAIAGAQFAREQLCAPEKHRNLWLRALSF